jgi:hypothetical protein
MAFRFDFTLVVEDVDRLLIIKSSHDAVESERVLDSRMAGAPALHFICRATYTERRRTRRTASERRLSLSWEQAQTSGYSGVLAVRSPAFLLIRRSRVRNPLGSLAAVLGWSGHLQHRSRGSDRDKPMISGAS